MELFWWVVVWILIFAGLAGTLLPLLPGPVIIFAGAAASHFALGAVGWRTLAILLVLVLLAQVVDFVSGAAGARWFGASRWGAIGGMAGAVIGLFFGLIGLLIGPLLGAMALELMAGRGLLPAGISGWGTLLGTTLGLVVKFVIALAMVACFAFSLALR